jgi:hypothetical protein
MGQVNFQYLYALIIINESTVFPIDLDTNAHIQDNQVMYSIHEKLTKEDIYPHYIAEPNNGTELYSVLTQQNHKEA